MERLKQRLTTAKEALHALTSVLTMEPSTIVRDAAIKRFEFTFEVFWKLIKLYLENCEGIETASPKSAARGCFQVGLLDEEQTSLFLSSITERNLTVHTYNETLIQHIYEHLPKYSELYANLLSKMQKNIEEKK